ncbi:unnamed protein product [Arabidopsis lyrata]|uniref:NYN domain-containing protein n=1 Tax=Arabidopsis lyrata subsp. lyrata TaxID=81972 RepID=D7KP81_ARALL|nr:hypothetical protein ARALYDRAFT_887275 [Arabidopsis lyrata subsp. lyrata]CAH8250807.1 unnamed protein product [Arabidopsis lyrata]
MFRLRGCGGGGEEAAKAAKIAVWWDMVECPIPEGFDARRVRPSLEAAFKKLGYSGPVSITAYGDQTHTSVDLLRCLSSTSLCCTYQIRFIDPWN